jgi:hypothetical protein
MNQLANLGFLSGTFKLVNSGGNPTFDGNATTYQAPDGTYQIASDPGAFLPDQNFICGLGSVDSNGQRIPVATVRQHILPPILSCPHPWRRVGYAMRETQQKG